MSTVKLQLVFDVTYEMNGDEPKLLDKNLRSMCLKAYRSGMLTANTSAFIESCGVHVAQLAEELEERELTLGEGEEP